MMYAYSDVECLSFQAGFCFFARLLTPKIKSWKKWKKTPGHIILLHMCATNQDHMMFGSSWYMKFNKQNFFVILGIFLPFYSPNTLKMNISKMRKALEISSFYTGVPKTMIICYTVLEIWHMLDVIVVFILGYQVFFQALFYNQ